MGIRKFRQLARTEGAIFQDLAQPFLGALALEYVDGLVDAQLEDAGTIVGEDIPMQSP